MAKKEMLSVRESFIRHIESRILSGELKAGDQLPTARELCTQMGISLTVVNAGMAELQSKGFVEIKPRHGVYVTDYRIKGTPGMLSAILAYRGGRLNAHDVRSFCETRLALDPLVAELAIKRAGDTEIEEWGMMLDQLHREKEISSFCEQITEYFHRLYLMSDNPILAMFFRSAMEPQQRMYTMFIEKNGRDAILQNADEVFRYVRERDAESAARCLREAMMLPMEGDTSII